MTKHYKHNIILFLLAINSQKFALGETPWLKDALPCWRSLCFLIITIAMLLTGPHAMPVGHLVHLVIYRKCYRFERAFFTLRCFFTGSQQFNLVSRASCWSSKHSPSQTICLNHNNPETSWSEWFSFKAYHIKEKLLVVNILVLLFWNV